MYENGQPVDPMKIVSGKPELPTPLIASIMNYIVYNPYWNVPDHLVRKVTAPNVLKQGNAYLKRQGYRVMADWTVNSAVVPWTDIDWKAVLAGNVHIRVRQDPGPKNSMGKLKFPFPNGEDIYLHNSPEREYFDKNARSLSNGCVRLEDAKRLGRWLLGQEPVAPSQDAEVQVQLPHGVPVYVTYITAQVQNLAQGQAVVVVRSLGLIGNGQDPQQRMLAMTDPVEAARYLRAEEARRAGEIRQVVVASVNNVPVRVDNWSMAARSSTPTGRRASTTRP